MSSPPPLKHHVWQTDVSDEDLPDDRFSHHVNNARYFHFINRTFRGWYIAMGLRDLASTHTAIMVRSEYDFLREVSPPSRIECSIAVAQVGRTSLQHDVEIYDLGIGGVDKPVLVGRGRVTHVCIDRTTHQSVAWPAPLLDLCWDRPRH